MSLPVNLKATVRQYGTLLLGSAILAFGLFNIHSQSQITEGGVLGTMLLLDHWFGISPGITGPIMDLTCYFFGYRLLGKAFLKYAVVATCGFSLFYNIFELTGPMLPSMGGTPLLAALAGGVFVGVGVGLVVRVGGASGGDDALALILAKVTGCKISKAYLLTDVTVLLLSLSYVPVYKIACSLVTVTLSSFIIGRIHLGKATREQKPEEPKGGLAGDSSEESLRENHTETLEEDLGERFEENIGDHLGEKFGETHADIPIEPLREEL